MGLNNIQRSKQKVLNRPMFAKMKDGTIKPVQYHWIGAAINVGSKVAPYVGRYGVKPLWGAAKKGLGYFKPWGWSSGTRASGNQIIKEGINKGKKFKDVFPNLFRQGNMPRFNITSTSPANIALQSGVTAATAAPYAYNWMKGDDKKDGSLESVMPPPGTPGGAAGSTIEETEKFTAKDKKKEENITDTITEDIKSGNMDEMIKDKITLFEKYLGKDTDKRKKGALYNAMVEFGLNLASARGGNTMDKIARSAKDPLANFAEVGKQILDRAEKIKMAGVESGITAYEKAEDRAVDREAIAADVYIEEMKLQAPKTDRLTFVSEKFDSIAANPDLVYSLTDFAYTKDKKGKRIKRPEFENQSDGQILQSVIDDMWRKGNAVEIPSGAAGDELFASLPSGTYYLDVETGIYNTKP